MKKEREALIFICFYQCVYGSRIRETRGRHGVWWFRAYTGALGTASEASFPLAQTLRGRDVDTNAWIPAANMGEVDRAPRSWLLALVQSRSLQAFE